MAVGKIGQIAVDFIARTQKFTKGVNVATKKVDSFAARTKAHIKTLGPGILGLAGGFGVAGVAGAVQETINRIDDLNKTAARLGTPIEKLQELQFAARMSGINMNQFNVSLQRMRRRVSDAAEHGGPLADRLESMGISVERIRHADAATQFEMIITAINKLPQEDRVSAAFAFFDSEGVKNLNLAGANLGEFAKQARKLGQVVSQQDADRMTQFSDTLEKLSAFVQGQVTTIVVDVSPAVTEALRLVESIQNLIDRTTGKGGLGKTVFKSGQRLFPPTLRPVETTREGFRGLNAVLNKLNNAIDGNTQALQRGQVAAVNIPE